MVENREVWLRSGHCSLMGSHSSLHGGAFHSLQGVFGTAPLPGKKLLTSWTQLGYYHKYCMYIWGLFSGKRAGLISA